LLLRAAIFDIEGTLLRRRPGSALERTVEGLRRAHAVLAAAGLPLPDLRTTFSLVHRELSNAAAGLAFGNFRENSIPALVRSFLKKAFPDAPPEAVEAALREWYGPVAAAAVPVPGAREALEAAAAAGWKRGAAGNSPWGSAFVLRDLEFAGLAESVDSLVCSADVGYRKPNLFLLQKALADLGVEGREAVHLGDDPREDVEAPQELGMLAVVIAPPGSVPRADRTIGSLFEVPALLRELAGRRP
jgi:FMN phosphatase YigB (HAD superfamily)